MSERRIDAGPRRLVFWTDSFWPRIGGNESWSLRLIRELTRRGREVRIVEVGYADAGESGEAEGVPILRIPARRAFETGDGAGLGRARHAVSEFLGGFPADLTIVSAYGAEALVLLSLMGSRLTAPQLAVVHAEWPAASLLPGALAGRLLDRAARVLVFDPAMADWLTAAHPASRAKLVLLDQAVADTGTPIPRGGEDILFCGRLTEQKAGDIAIAAFARIAAAAPEARLTVAGEGHEEPALRAQAQALGIADRVRFIGRVPLDAMPALFDASALVLMPSRFEPFGLVALEAAVRGRPVVASGVGGLARIVEDGITGCLCVPDDIDGFAIAILSLLNDPARADRLGEAARESALRRFDWSAHVGSFERLMADSAAVQPDESSACVS